MTVQDLSVTGLRCLLSSAPTAAASGTPALGDTVRVFFPASGSTVKPCARLHWKEHTTQGVMMGLEFVDLPLDDVDLLGDLVAAAE